MTNYHPPRQRRAARPPEQDGAPVQAYIWAIPGWKRNLGHRRDDLIVRTVPDVRTAVRWVVLARGRGTTA